MLPVLLALAVAPQTDTGPAEWTDYRGPRLDGSAPGATPPLTWSEERNVAWKTEIHGRGWSSPVVADGRIWLTTATPKGKRLSVLAVDVASGEVLVDRVLFEVEEPEPRNALNSYASPSATLGGGRVFVHFGTYGTACLDADSGETLWQRDDLHCDHMQGPGSSPVFHEGRVFLHYDGGDQQYIVALDAGSGETVWRKPRSADLESVIDDRRKAYSTPILVTAEADGAARVELVSTGALATYAYDPATGNELWRVEHSGYSMSSRPIHAEGLVVVNTGYDRPELWGIRPGGFEGPRFVWRNTKSAPTMPSPVAVDGRLFQVSNTGMASCLDVLTGETLWRERLEADHCASLLTAAGRVYFFDREGVTRVVAAGPRFELLAESKLDAGFMASPAVLGDALILRTETHLYRIEEADPAEDGE